MKKMPKTLPKSLVWAFMAFAFMGFIDATYLAVMHYGGGTLTCGLFGGCNEVLASEYSEMFGIPTALYGAAYYLSILILAVLYLDRKNATVAKILSLFTIAGFATSAYLVYLQVYVIGYICQYCMLSALTSTALFIIGMFSYFKYLKK